MGYPSLVLMLLSLTLSESHAQSSTSPKQRNTQSQTTVRSTVSRYITAIQKRDFHTIVELNSHYATGENLIRKQTPNALWPNLIRAYREAMVLELAHREYSEANGTTDLQTILSGYSAEYEVKALDRLQELLPQTCRWSIIEIRHEPRSPTYPSLTLDTVYVTILYSVPDQAPTIGGKTLKKTIIELRVIGPQPFYMQSYNEVGVGNEFWDSGK